MLSTDDLFKGRHFDKEIIVLCVRWRLRFKLSFQGLAEMMAERGMCLAHTPIMRWIARYVPEFERRWTRIACRVRAFWRVDETYVKIKGRWTLMASLSNHLSCGPQRGKDGRCPPRGQAGCRCSRSVFPRAITSQGRLFRAITLDGRQTSYRTAREILGEQRRGEEIRIRSSKHLNNLIEQDHRPIKLCLSPMLGLKRIQGPTITIAGIALMHRIRPSWGSGGQFNLGAHHIKGKTTPEIWNAVLAA